VARIASVIASLAALLVLPAAASAVAPDPNPWLNRHFLNIAHQGGEDEAPTNTLFALKSSVTARGADMIEIDVNRTEDGQLVVVHDDTYTRAAFHPTLPEVRPGNEWTGILLAEAKEMDAGYWFTPGSYSHGKPEAEYLYRGIATGAKPPPPGYTADDFKIPTLQEVLDAFPDTPVNIEIKMEKNPAPENPDCESLEDENPCDDVEASKETAELLAAVLDEPQYAARDDIIVVSFSDELTAHFHAADAEPKVALAPAEGDATAYGLAGATPDPDVAAFQVPPQHPSLPGINVPKFLLDPIPGLRPGAHEDGYAVHVWANGNEGDAEYAEMVALGVDGYMASKPGQLHAYLCAAEVPRPDGSDRCPNPAQPAAAKKCKKAKKKSKKGSAAAKKKAKKCKKKKKKKKRKGKKKGR
jgi:glycerophosphoryl diester phosphodiesterase